MKIKSIIGLCAIALISSCGSNNSSSEYKEPDPKPYNDSLAAFIKTNKTKLDSLMIKMETFAKDVDAGKYKVKNKIVMTDTTGLNFRPILNRYAFANVEKEFNSIYLSDNTVLGTPLPADMPEDFFVPQDFKRAKELIKTGKYDHAGSYGQSLFQEIHNDRVILESYLNLRYMVYIKNQKYTKGVISAILSTYDIPVLEGVIYIYDIKNNKFCGASEFFSSGPKTLNYLYKEGDLTDQQNKAEEALEAQTADTVKYRTINLLNEIVRINEGSIE